MRAIPKMVGGVYLSGGITKLELVSCYCCLTKIKFIIFCKYVLLLAYLFPSNHVESDKTTDDCRSQIVRVASGLPII